MRCSTDVSRIPGELAARDGQFRFSSFDFLKLAAPNTLSAVSMPLAGLINTMVLGQVGDASMIGGVAISSALLNIVFFAFNFMRSGTLGLTAQAFGAGDAAEQKAIAVRSGLLAAAIGCLVIALQAPIFRIGLHAFGTQGEVDEAARTYLSIRIWAAPFTLLNYAVIGWVMGRSHAVLALVLQVIGNGLNALTSIAFVLVFDMGIQGAALACVLSEVVGAVLGVAIVAGTAAGWQSRNVFETAQFVRMLKVNGDIFVRSLFLFLALALFTRMGTDFGPAVLAANAILLGIFQTSAAGLDGISAAAEQIVGRSVGAGSVAAFKRAVRISLLWGAVTALIIAVALLAWGAPLIALSSKAPEVVAASAQYGPWVPIALLSSVIAYQMDGIFVGATWSKGMRDIMMTSAAVFAAAAYLLSDIFGNHGLWGAFTIFLCTRGCLSTWYLRRKIVAFPDASPSHSSPSAPSPVAE